jgi:thiol-disulfide isomerase/thioredoxin
MKGLFICFLFTTIINLYSYSQTSKGYTIDGHVEGLKDGDKVIMLLSFSDWGFVRRDSAYVKNGTFHIDGFVPEGPRFYYLSFERLSKVVRLLIDNNEQIKIKSSDINKIQHTILEHWLTIEGSPTNYAWSCLFLTTKSYRQNLGLINNYALKIKDSVGFDKALLGGLFSIKNEINNGYYNNYFNNPAPDHIKAIPEIIDVNLFELSHHASFWLNVYNNLDDNLKNSFYGKSIKEKLPLCVDQVFPPFILSTPEGTSLSSKDIISKGKTTIIQFWASNSYDLDKYQSELINLYKKYHDKGLNIVGISSDVSSKKWKVALQDLPWHQVSDLKGEGGVVGKIYHEYGDPTSLVRNTTNVLIDDKGKIIAWDINGLELQMYLSNIMDN